jgi:hypothetical protein
MSQQQTLSPTSSTSRFSVTFTRSIKNVKITNKNSSAWLEHQNTAFQKHVQYREENQVGLWASLYSSAATYDLLTSMSKESIIRDENAASSVASRVNELNINQQQQQQNAMKTIKLNRVSKTEDNKINKTPQQLLLEKERPTIVYALKGLHEARRLELSRYCIAEQHSEQRQQIEANWSLLITCLDEALKEGGGGEPYQVLNIIVQFGLFYSELPSPAYGRRPLCIQEIHQRLVQNVDSPQTVSALMEAFDYLHRKDSGRLSPEQESKMQRKMLLNNNNAHHHHLFIQYCSDHFPIASPNERNNSYVAVSKEIRMLLVLKKLRETRAKFLNSFDDVPTTTPLVDERPYWRNYFACCYSPSSSCTSTPLLNVKNNKTPASSFSEEDDVMMHNHQHRRRDSGSSLSFLQQQQQMQIKHNNNNDNNTTDISRTQLAVSQSATGGLSENDDDEDEIENTGLLRVYSTLTPRQQRKNVTQNNYYTLNNVGARKTK